MSSAQEFFVTGMVHLNVSVTSFDDVRLQLFVCTFGTRPDICSTCWELTYKLRQKMRGSPKPINMLMALALMKNYERQRKLAAAFGVSTDTFRYYANRFAYAISSLKSAVICWYKRFMGAPASNEYFVSIDGTDFHRQEDYTKFNPQLCSHKTNWPAYRYDILVSTSSPAIVGINGPFIAGSNPDLKIFRETTKKKLSDGENVLGDRGI